MMKVSPRPSTSGIIAVCVMRTKLPTLRKLGLKPEMIAQSRISTRTGAQDAARQRRLRCTGPALEPAWLADVCTVIAASAP